MEEFQKNLKEAIRQLKIADHLTYVTFPIVNEKRLLLKIFDEIYNSVINCIYSILKYEYYYKRIILYADFNDNFETFMSLSKNYGLTSEQVRKIKLIIEINKKHKKSPLEFVKKEKIVIMSDNLNTEIIDLRSIKEYLLLAKEFLMKVSKRVQ